MINNLKAGDSGEVFIVHDNLNGVFNYFVDHDCWIAIFSLRNDLNYCTTEVLKYSDEDSKFLTYIRNNTQLKTWNWIMLGEKERVEVFTPACEAVKILWGIK